MGQNFCSEVQQKISENPKSSMRLISVDLSASKSKGKSSRNPTNFTDLKNFLRITLNKVWIFATGF